LSIIELFVRAWHFFWVEIVESQNIIIYTAPRRFNSSDFVSPIMVVKL